MINITVIDMETKQVLQSTCADGIIGFLEDVKNADDVKTSDAGAMLNGPFSAEDQVELLAAGINGLFGTLERQTKISKAVLKMLLYAKIEVTDVEDDGGDGDDHTD